MKCFTLLITTIVVLIVLMELADAWRGNFYTVRRSRRKRIYYCACWYWWWGCSYWRYYLRTEYYYINICRPGWKHNGDQNCNEPVCRPTCVNGGTCVNPNVCDCPSWSQGVGCSSLTCSYKRPCYPGNCEGGTQCTCEPGFIKQSDYDGCLAFNETHNKLRPVVGKSNVTLSHIRRIDGKVDFMFILEGLEEEEPGKMEIIWSNQKRFNNLYFEYITYFSKPENLPKRPNYVSDAEIGIVESIIEANVSKAPRDGGRIRDEGSFKVYKCEGGFSKDNPAIELATCEINDDQFKTLIEHGDWLNIKFKSSSGGFQQLINIDQQGIPYSRKYYRGLQDIREVQFNFDFVAPKHCLETRTCNSASDILRVEKEFTKDPIKIFWSRWTDELCGVWEYYVEVFKLTPDLYDKLVEAEPLKPVFKTTIVHRRSGIAYPSYKPKEPGMYSVLMETRDFANNSRIARRLVLFDDQSEIILNEEPDGNLYVSSAVNETGYMWQTSSEGNDVKIDVVWENHFINEIVEDNKLLYPVDKYPIQFKEIQDDGILYSQKFVEDSLDDYEGNRTLDAIENFHGIVKFEVATVLSKDDEEPKSSWKTVEPLQEKTSFKLKLQEGSRVRVWVRATDVMGNIKTDSTLVRFDNTEPAISTSGEGHMFEPNIDSGQFNFSSRIKFIASDKESGVHKIGFSITVKTTGKQDRVIYEGFAPATILDTTTDPLCNVIEGKCFKPFQELYLDNCWFMVSKNDLDISTASVDVYAYNQALLNSSATFDIGPVKNLEGLEKYTGPENIRIESPTPNGFRVAWDLPEKTSCYGLADIALVLLRKDDKEPIKTYYTSGSSKYFDILGLDAVTEYQINFGIKMPQASAIQQTDISLSAKTDTSVPPPSNVNLGAIHPVPELRFKEVPQTRPPFKLRYYPYMQFRCVFSNSSDYFYNVQWKIGGKPVASLGPSQHMDELSLHEQMFIDLPLGFMVQCSVTVSAVKFGQQTEPQYSDNFYAGVKVYNSTVYLKKGSHTQIGMSSSLPIGCEHFDKFHKECKDELRISDAAELKCLQETVNNVVTTDSTKCTEYIKTLYKGATWDPDKLYHFKIVTSDIDYEDKSLFDLQLKFSGNMKHKFWQNKGLPDVKVVVLDNEEYKEKVCYSHIDPHMRTADGYHYEQQQEGNFILYYNQQYNIEVQETTKSCGRSAKCACGVSVRAGKDVFMINKCGKTSFLGFSQCDDGGILQVVRNNDLSYTIFTPIGTKITINLPTKEYLNTDIKMAPKDKYNVRGLCGNFDGDVTNDLVHSDGKKSELETNTDVHGRHHKEFANSWRVPEEKLYSRKKRSLESWANLNGLYCVCQKGKGVTSAEALCSSTQYHDCTMQKSITKTKCYIYNYRKKRSPIAHEKEMDRLFELMQPVKHHDVKKRQTNVDMISKTQARQRCSNMIQGSLAFSSYRNMTASEDPNAVINQCIFDIMATNDETFADVHVDSVNTIVKGMMDEVPTYVETNKKEVQVFLKNSCSSNCSNRGNCTEEGECICSQYYHGAICDIDERVPPIVTDIEGGGVCDTGDGVDCRCFYLRGDNFLENMKCKIVTSEISITGEKISVTTETLAGGYEDVFTGLCCIPEENVFASDMFVREHEVSVSSDGVHFGENNTMYIFDSTCQKLESLSTGRPSFILKDGFCFIEHACIKDTYAFLSENDTCLSCNISVSVTNWTEANLEICIPTTTSTTTKSTKPCTSNVTALESIDGVDNQTLTTVTPTTLPPQTTTALSSKKKCKAKGMRRLKERKRKLSLRNKKRKSKIQRLSKQINRLKQILDRVHDKGKESNNKSATTQQP